MNDTIEQNQISYAEESEIKMIKFMQLNLHKSSDPSMNFMKLLSDQPIKTIGCITEPYHYKGKIYTRLAKEHNCYYIGTNPRAAILVPKSIKKCIVLNNFSNSDQITIEIGLNMNTSLIICSLYMDILVSIPSKELNKLLHFCFTQNKELIICTDSNCHGFLWSDSENARGEKLTEIIGAYNLQILNTGREPTFENARCKTIIDLSLTMNIDQNYIKNWKVDKTYQFSDHKLITFYLDKEIEFVDKKFYTTDWKKLRNNLRGINWPKFNICGAEALDVFTNYWTETIMFWVQECQKEVKRECKTWWTNELSELTKETQDLHKVWKRTDDPDDQERFKKASKNLVKERRKAKRLDFEIFCTTLTDPKMLANLAKQKSHNNFQPTLKKDNDEFTSTGQETIDLLVSTFFPYNKKYEGQPIIKPKNIIYIRNFKDLDKDLTLKKFKEAIRELKNNKKEGIDGITPRILKNLDDESLKFVLKLYKCSIALNYIPEIWQTGKVIMLPKPGLKLDTPKSMRPICLSSFVFKLCEKLVKWRWIRKFDIENKLHKNQYGFTAGVSCDTALSHFVTNIERSLECNKLAVTIFIDIVAAFDHVHAESLRKGFKDLDCWDSSTEWYCSYVQERIAEVHYAGHSGKYIIDHGTPQGGMDSTLAFKIVFNSLLILFDNTATLSIGLADDGSCTVSGPDLDTLVDLQRQNLSQIENWATENNFRINPNKTKVMIFSRRKVPEKKLNSYKTKLIIYNQELEIVDSYKYLGVSINKTLNWTLTLKEKLPKVKRLLFMLKAYVGKNWGLNPKRALWIYKQCILPKLLYGCFLYGKHLEQENIINELRKVQRLGAMIIAPCFPSTPTISLEVLLGLTPIDLVATEFAIKAYMRIEDKFAIRSTKGHLAWAKTILNKANLKVNIFSDMIKFKHFNKDFRIIIRDGVAKWKNNELGIYTDGSKDEFENTGYAFIILGDENLVLHNEEKSLNKSGSVFQAEVAAILDSAIWAHQNYDQIISYNSSIRKINFYVDSQAALLALDSNTIDNKLVHDCIKSLNKLARNFAIDLNWTKAHVGQRWNEEVDTLAKNATKTKIFGPEPIILGTRRNYGNQIRKFLFNTWKSRWKQETRRKDGGILARQTKEIIPDLNKNISKVLLSLDRQILYKAIQLLTGHNVLKRHLTVIKWTENPNCRACGECVEESSWHILTRCPGLAQLRRNCFEVEFIDKCEQIQYGKICAFIRGLKDLLEYDASG